MGVNSPPLRFGLIFGVVFVILMTAFEASRGSTFEKFVVEDAILLPTTALMNALTPQEPVELRGRTLVSATSKLHVTRGCEGVEMFLLLAAAILAYPASVKQRLWGFLLGAILAYALSIARLVVLDYSLRHLPAAWEMLHGLIMPLAPIVALALFFLHWSSRSLTPAAAGQDSHAT